MQALVKKKGEWTVVTMKGRIQLEKAGAFREACMRALEAQKVVFEMSHLQFVGSTGMTEFFQCLADMQKEKGCSVGMVGLSDDFKRFVSVSAAAQIRIFARLEDAFNSSHLDFESPESCGSMKDSTSQEPTETESAAPTLRSFGST
ncbi:MAG: STAS domain-containing protein [Bdellovibrionales bacterium]